MRARTLNGHLRRGRARALAKHEEPLADAVASVLEEAGEKAARRFAAKAHDHLTAAAPSPEATMVAVYPTPEQAVALAQPGGELAEILHVTLAYLGELDPDQAEAALAAVRQVAAEHGPLEGIVGGIAAFAASESSDGVCPSIVLPDVPGLAELRQAVCDALEEAGFEYAMNHGWCPHLTIAYTEEPATPPGYLLGQPLTFDKLTVARGDAPRDVPLGGGILTAGGPPDWTAPHTDEVVDVAALAAALRGKSDPVRQAVAETLMTKALKAVGLSFDVENPLVGSVLSRSGAQVTNIAETTRLNVMRAIREAYEQGLTIPDTADLIREGMNAAAPARGRLIARTELAAVANGAAVAAAQIVGQEAGIAYYKRWLCAPGAEYPRHEDYEGLDGQTVALEEMFDVGGFQAEYPGDPNLPPDECCQCRCAVSMVESPDAEEDGEVVAALTSDAESSQGGTLSRTRKPPQDATLAERRTAAREALTAAGVAPPLITSYEMTMGSLTERWFTQAALEAGYAELQRDSWPTEAAALEDDPRITFRNGAGEAVYRLGDGTIALVSINWGTLRMYVAGRTRAATLGACGAFRERYPASYLMEDDSRVPITFWTMGEFGPHQRLRKIEASPWEDIERNYSGTVREHLDGMMGWEGAPGADGQLLLLQGPPGTGKTWVLRALAAGWAPWAEFHYITDPDVFFVEKPSYMVDVLLSESYSAIEESTGDVYDEQDPGGKWRVLILEDTGELLAADAKQAYGQGLSRLLNVVDGMIGQGLRVLAIVTTNDELGDLHPAVTRKGRCAAQVEFGPLSATEASEWLGEEVTEELTLAELYARRNEKDAAPSSDATANLGGDVTTAAHSIPAAMDERFFRQIAALALTSPAAAGRGLTEDDVVAKLRERVSGGLVLDRAAVENLAAGDDVLPAEHQPADDRPDRQPTPEAPALEPAAGARLRWEATFCPEGTMTDDGRLLWPGSTGNRDLPLTLMAMTETSEGGHVGAEVAGRIDDIFRAVVRPTLNLVHATGVFDDGDYGSEVARLVDDQTLRGLSVDLAIHDFDFIPASRLFDENGELRLDALEWRDDPGEEVNILDILYGDDDDLVFVSKESVIMGATVCPFPAFADASIALTASASGGLVATVRRQASFTVTRAAAEPDAPAGAQEPQEESLTASAAGMAPAVPPAEWFEDPGLDGPSALVVTDEGRVYGHAAEWRTCHTGFANVCVEPPQSHSGYAYFLLGELEVEGGEPVAVGQITLDAPHAGLSLSRRAATAHYDHTGTAVADVTCGEDEHGIWFSGALRPDLPAERVREFKAAKISGDWRGVNGHREMIAMLCVNVPGFPVPRTRAVVAAAEDGGRVLALVAAGIVGADPDPEPVEELTAEEGARIAALGARAAGGIEGLAALAAGSSSPS